ncbi:unnamed protein product [marine sediment metagenome]|uniref:Uncharacterized protein n=1 Tax=marine sediment metagenome TaxID=412755 RepID=X1TFU4_9ZZZZ
MVTVKGLQQRIVKALETGQDPAPLLKELAELRTKNATEAEGETTEVESSCRVCQHRERGAIDKALQEGRSLRDIETEFNVSRSTLSRHKNHCLNLRAIRLVEDSEG